MSISYKATQSISPKYGLFSSLDWWNWHCTRWATDSHLRCSRSDHNLVVVFSTQCNRCIKSSKYYKRLKRMVLFDSTKKILNKIIKNYMKKTFCTHKGVCIYVKLNYKWVCVCVCVCVCARVCERVRVCMYVWMNLKHLSAIFLLGSETWELFHTKN